MFVLVLVLFSVFCTTLASYGDTRAIYHECFQECKLQNCSDQVKLNTFYANQDFWLSAFRWTCVEECRYNCMWETVTIFEENGIKAPQFYGKWPFVRFLGLQEPASALFSVLNALSVYRFYNIVRAETAGAGGMRTLWLLWGLMAVHTWCWSTVFHAKDTPFTEKMDYFCAFSSVLSLFYLAVMRLVRPGCSAISAAVISLPFFYVFQRHVLSMIRKFDYGYNMKVNVICGVLSTVTWFGVFAREYRRGRWRHLWPLLMSIMWANLALSLELLDFRPIWWTIDAHALWHLATVPVPWLIAKFVIKDCLYLSMPTFGDLRSSSRKNV